MPIADFNEHTFILGEKEVTGRKILEKFEPEHVVVYHIDDIAAMAFRDMGTDNHYIRKEFPDWTPGFGNDIDLFMMYKDDVLCMAGFEELDDELDDTSEDIPIIPYLNYGLHTPFEYVEFWIANKNLSRRAQN